MIELDHTLKNEVDDLREKEIMTFKAILATLEGFLDLRDPAKEYRRITKNDY